jgi:hypothetical protein
MSIIKLSKLLAPPSKIAHNLTGAKSLEATLSPHWQRYDSAVASHPAFNEDVENLPPLTSNDRERQLQGSISQLSNSISVVQDRNVLRFVGWPVQKEGWWTRVLHTSTDHRAVEQYHQPQPPGLFWMATTANLLKMPGRMALTAKLRIRFFTSHPKVSGP